MAEKLGNGGNGNESYDPNTGRYIGNSEIAGKIAKGTYGEKIKQLYNSLSDVDKSNLVQEFSSYVASQKQSVPSISSLSDVQVETFKANNPNLYQGEVDLAAKAIREYEKIEPSITNELVDIATDYGGMLVGLDHRLKTLESTIGRMEKNGGGQGDNFDNEKALYGVKDILRYTACFSDANFEKSVHKMASDMQEKYKLVRVLNKMTPGSLYKGVNCLFADDNGYIFEMQFHTPESIKVKDGLDVDLTNKKITKDASATSSHSLYEHIRDVKTRAKNGQASIQEINDSKKLNADLAAIWGKVNNHPNIDFRRELPSKFKKRTNS